RRALEPILPDVSVQGQALLVHVASHRFRVDAVSQAPGMMPAELVEARLEDFSIRRWWRDLGKDLDALIVLDALMLELGELLSAELVHLTGENSTGVLQRRFDRREDR